MGARKECESCGDVCSTRSVILPNGDRRRLCGPCDKKWMQVWRAFTESQPRQANRVRVDANDQLVTDGGQSVDGSDHEFDVGDKFHGLPEWTYKITNRMVDVDTGDVLYRLSGYGELAGNETKVLTESSLKSNFEEIVDCSEDTEGER